MIVLASIPVLSGIFDLLGQLVDIIVTGLVTWLNLFIEAVAAALSVFIALLPDMPEPPEAPAAEWVGWLNWVLPVSELVSGLLVFVGLWAVYLLVRIPLRWLRAL